MILSGALDIRVEREGVTQTIATLRAGDFVGERSLMTGEPRSASAIAASDTVAIVIAKSDMLALLREDAELAARIAKVMAARDVERERIAHDIHAQGEIATGLLERIRAFFAL